MRLDSQRSLKLKPKQMGEWSEWRLHIFPYLIFPYLQPSLLPVAVILVASLISANVPAALTAYWRLRMLEFTDEHCRLAVVQHLDNRDLQMQYVRFHQSQ